MRHCDLREHSRIQVKEKGREPCRFLFIKYHRDPTTSQVVVEVPGPISLWVGKYNEVCRLAVVPLAAEEEDRQGLVIEFLPLDPGDGSSDKLGVVVPFDWSRGAHAAILLTFRSDGCVVAFRALPFAHCRSPVICSAISFESATKSTSTSPTVKSEGSSSSANARYMASMNTCSISAPVSPSVDLLNCARSNCRGSRRCLVTWICQISSRSSRFGRSTKK